MISIQVDNTRSSSLAEVALRLGALPTDIPKAVVRALDAGSQILIGMAKRDPKRFKGKGPFPVGQHRLGRVSQNLWRGLFSAAPSKGGTPGSYLLSFGSTARTSKGVNYFAVHEFGAKGTAKVAAFTHPNLFGRGPAKIGAHNRKFNFPARAPMRTHLQQHADKVLRQSVEDELESLVDSLTT
ncbi:hypothetical protein AAFN60_02055 [Roseibacillus persicicus]|uniref:hypothetical protein n=1 Tax=Roseibacillus persicicus TaxID=454148 RepID=UPI00398B1298